MINKVAIVGAGTMGSGIALSVAQSGCNVVMFDVNDAVLLKASKTILHNVNKLVEKEKISREIADDVINRITFTNAMSDCIADVIIEAIVEKLEVKHEVFLQLAEINSPTTILASNTSSLSISAIQKNIPFPNRIAGMHYFNPAHIMKLVEIIRGNDTDDNTIQTLASFAKLQQKTPVICSDSPGFIVNRVARHFYLESLKAAEKGAADIKVIDEILEATGFKMGPFKLMDMIGMDINLAVTESLYHAFNETVRFKPNMLQIEKVKNGDLGRKTGKGFYLYNNV
ncbi:MAG: 3-hydroxybutyryl-CoA dehydrogenase [Ferruginibacter sp.]|nr:3-hydroxybutyryl-CoA dehydrogenase [Ferruginibacter sp.]